MPDMTDRSPAPPPSVELETALYLLKDYLEKDKHLASKGITLEQVFHGIGDLSARVLGLRDAVGDIVKEQIAQGMRIERHGRKLRELRDVVNRMNGHDDDDPPEDTGSFRVEDTRRAVELSELQKKWEMSEAEKRELRKEERDKETWWSRQRSLWLVILAMTFLSAILSGCVGVGLFYLTHGK